MPIFNTSSDCTWDLSSNCIDIWRFSLKDSLDWSLILSPSENARIRRFYFEKHKRRFLQAHGILRDILGKYVHTPPEQIMLATDAYGKPYIINSNVFFNLSHSGEYALLAVGKGYPVGVDLEQYSERAFTGVAAQMFSQQEQRQLIASPAHLTNAVFFSIWSQKEAFIKACGLGLRYPTKKFSVQALSNKIYQVYDSVHDKQWELYSFFPLPGYAGAVCYDSAYQTLNFYQY